MTGRDFNLISNDFYLQNLVYTLNCFYTELNEELYEPWPFRDGVDVTGKKRWRMHNQIVTIIYYDKNIFKE